MSIYLDDDQFKVELTGGQIVLTERSIETSRETGELFTRYRAPRFFTQPEWLFLYLLRKKICEKDVNTFAELRDNIKAAEKHVIGIAGELKEALKAVKQE